MANYVKNIINFSGAKESLEKLIAYLGQGNRTELDFNLIVPVPEELKEADSNVDKEGMAVAEYLMDGTFEGLNLKLTFHDNVRASMEAAVGKSFKTDRELVKEYMIYLLKKPYIADDYWKRCMKWYRNYKKYGHSDWYSWQVANWGTKWNAVEPDSLDVLIPWKTSARGNYSMQYVFNTAWAMPAPVIKKLSSLFPDIRMEVQYADEDMGQNCGIITYENGEVVNTVAYPDYSRDAYELALSVWNSEDMMDFLEQDENGNWYINMDAYYENEA